jgi:hypothetical protein
MASVLSQVENLVAMFEANNLKDGNTKNGAIDTLVELIQSQKTTPPSTTTTNPSA